MMKYRPYRAYTVVIFYNPMACAIGYEMSPLWGLNVNSKLESIIDILSALSDLVFLPTEVFSQLLFCSII